MESQFLPPLLNPRTTTPSLFFCFLKKNVAVENKYSVLDLPENFPAEPVMKINNLSRPKVPAPPPPSESNGRPLTCGHFLKMKIVKDSPIKLTLKKAVARASTGCCNCQLN